MSRRSELLARFDSPSAFWPSMHLSREGCCFGTDGASVRPPVCTRGYCHPKSPVTACVVNTTQKPRNTCRLLALECSWSAKDSLRSFVFCSRRLQGCKRIAYVRASQCASRLVPVPFRAYSIPITLWDLHEHNLQLQVRPGKALAAQHRQVYLAVHLPPNH